MKRFLLYLMLLVTQVTGLTAVHAATMEAYAVLSTDETTLSFYYDTNKSSRSGTVYTAANFRKSSDGSWGAYSSHITKVVFDSSFANYTGLTSTANWFRECSKITTISGIANLNTQNVTNMSLMFEFCSSLTSLNLSSFNTQNVTDMRYMFYGCSSLTNLNLSSFNTQNVTNMSCMFRGCSSLTSLNLSSFNTQNVTSMGYMFCGCSSLTSLDLSSFNTQNVAGMYEMFSGCSSLTTLNLSSFNTQNVKYFYYMFSGCSSLKTIVVGGEWSTTNVTASNNMFAGCISLVGGDGTKFNSSYTDKTKAYAGQGGYLTLTGAATKEAYAVLSTDQTTLSFYYDTNKSSRSGTVYTAANFRNNSIDSWGAYSSNITKVVFDSSFANYTGLTSTAYWFHGCSKITTISGIANLNTQNVTNMSLMFEFCSSLTSLNLSSFNTQNVTYMNGMFEYCSSLTSLNLSSFNTQNVTDMSWMFYECRSLTSLNLSSFNTQNVTDMSYMFGGCSSLTSLNLSSFNTQNVTDMHSMFDGCSSLTSLDLSSFNTQNVTNMNGMFEYCSSLTSLNLSSFNTQNVTNMNCMFDGCSSLKTIVVGGEWSTTNVKYSNIMFKGCTSLVGGDGTKYNSSYIDKTKAYAGQGGYLTLKGGGTGTDTRTYNGRTWMIGDYAPIRYDFASINEAMASSMVKDDDVLLVFYSTVSGDQTVSKRVKIVGQNIYEKWNETQIQNLYIEAPQVTLDYIRVAKDIVVRDNDALIEHCYASGSVVSGLNWECDNAIINSCYIYGGVDDSNGDDWTISNSYVKGQEVGFTTGYSEAPADLPIFSEFDRWTQATVTAGEALPVKYIIYNVDSPKLVEYFWDSDPGWIKGSALKNANNNYIANTWNEGLTISTNGLSVGKHTLVVRVCSNSGYWAVATREVTVEQPVVANPKPVFSLVDFPTSGVNNDYKISFFVAAEGGLIDWVEYYWDNDPGEKKGHCIVDGGHDNGQGISRSDYLVDCGGLTGKHTLFVRAFCGSESTVVYIKEINLTAPAVDDNAINANDLAALKLISDNLGLNGYWSFANEGRVESDFPGVTFLNHRVIEINLYNRGLNGALSSSWMPSLSEITLLNLSCNNIYGDITPLVAKMPKLKTLYVDYNRITQVSGPLPASLTTLNAQGQMRIYSPLYSPHNFLFVDALVNGEFTPTTAPVGSAVSLALPSLFYYDADKNDNSLHADVQVVDLKSPTTIYGTYTYNGTNMGWKFTPQSAAGTTLENDKAVALVSNGTWQQWSAYPARLSVLLGDANIDGAVDVLDVQHTLNYILATAQPFNYWAANTYVDQNINVQDIVCTVNIMLGLPNNARRGHLARSMDRASAEASGDAQCWVYEQNGRVALFPAADIAALDIELEGVTTDEVSLLLRHSDFSMIGQNTATGSRYVIFSPTGSVIPAGKMASVLALSHSAVPVAVRCADINACEVAATVGQPTGISEVHSASEGTTIIETRLAPGIYIVRTIDANGNSKTVKVLKK